MSPQSEQIKRLCSKLETMQQAIELFNLAKSKTGPGSGHSLGAQGAPVLPAVCAFLASERLGNNDVTEGVAQKSACVAPKAFRTALATVRAALGPYLAKPRTIRRMSFEKLVNEHGVNEGHIPWMEEVAKSVRTSKLLDEQNFDSDSDIVRCMVFYWTCAALHIRSVKASTVRAEYDIQLRDFQDIQQIIDDTCSHIKDRIDSQRSPRADASTRSTTSSPQSPTKARAATTVDDMSPFKRKAIFDASALPSTPSKKQKTYSPSKLSQDPTTHTPTAKRINAAAGPISPMKSLKGSRSPQKEPSAYEKLRRLRETETAVLPVSPTKAGTSTPRHGRSGYRAELADQDDVDLAHLLAADADITEEDEPARCRHRRPAFFDRQFYRDRDPRVATEWDICEKNMRHLIHQMGHPFGAT